MTDLPHQLIETLRAARHVVALTGAGVSQESGLNTFRDAQVGFWAQYRPEDLATPQAFERDPQLVWDWYAMRRTQARAAAPNPGHLALAEMASLFESFTLLTQNVDGLHQRAGSPAVIELHGSIQNVRCASCGLHYETWQETSGQVPHCPACAGLLRPNVVWFGESLPSAALQAALDATQACDLFFSIGTSGLVHPAASLAYAALEHSACLVEINATETPLTVHATHALTGTSGQLLPSLLNAYHTAR
jgi:NAD-dependent deacetylase